ncbi:relA-associated inhibitor [Cyprinodon tularosa]|uniref:relA-associated inhibitor n=1 Tax=Cyprinodon tularosa TaxID=77115 RepID=UPI0018E25597|nr:relA-associated inhibitor [Cyprinodon tularosa]
MSSQTSFGNFLFQAIDNDLNASLAVADELSKEFNSMLQEASSNDKNASSESKTKSIHSRGKPQSYEPSSTPSPTYSSISSNGSSSSKPFSPGSSHYTSDLSISSNRNAPSPPVISNSPHSSPKMHRSVKPTHQRSGSDDYMLMTHSPQQSPHLPRSRSPSAFDSRPHGYNIDMERAQSHSRTPGSLDQSSHLASHQMPQNLLSPFDNNQISRRSPQPDRGSAQGFLRSPSPLSLNSQGSSTLPRNFTLFNKTEESQMRQKSPGKWNETDLDVSYDRKPHNTYDKTDWLRPSVPNSSWRESNLDGPPSASSPKKDHRSVAQQGSYSSLPRTARISVPPEAPSSGNSPYSLQPIISRVNMPPQHIQHRQKRRIPISVILRLQNPEYGQMSALQNQSREGQGDIAPYRPPDPAHRKMFHPNFPSNHYHSQHYPPELKQPAVYNDALHPGDIDAEIERLDYMHQNPANLENSSMPGGGNEIEQPAPRPLSPTRLQPVVAPEVQNPEFPDREELLLIRSEIPRPLKRRGSVDVSKGLKKASHYQPNQYKTIIHKILHKKQHRHKSGKGSDSSSDGEEPALPPVAPPSSGFKLLEPRAEDEKYNSILRKPGRKKSGRRARLHPLVLLLDAALMGELDTVIRAVKEIGDPSQSNDEGITGLHNAICGGHHEVADFLVRTGVNVSAPDSHGWTPLHCAASCNDRDMCEFLVRNGAAVMAFTHRDGATASQKCDPFLFGYDECESYLKAKEESMGVDNNGVLYALFSYQAQAPDELSFKEGDMVTILKKTEGSDWWWASLCGREGLVPNNFFGLFPKVRPKSIC